MPSSDATQAHHDTGDSAWSTERRRIVPPRQSGDMVAHKYRLLRPLGEGGMGEVWVAYNEVLEVEVAIKFIRTEYQDRDVLSQRLLTEARAAARLGDPAIIRVFDFGTTGDGAPFIVMELLHGEDLFTALNRHHKVSPVRALRLLLPISHALSVAHSHDIIHRDIKPENVFLEYGPGGTVQPKLLDFGIAKAEVATNLRLTARGGLLGSPSYMSPEQARGEEADERSDIWAFCVMLYAMLTGHLPFEGDNYNRLINSILTQDPVPITEHGVGDDELWSFIECGLRKDRQERWATIDDLGTALAAWLAANGEAHDVSGNALQGWLRLPPANYDPLTSLPPYRIGMSSFPANDALLTTPMKRVEAVDSPAHTRRTSGVLVAVIVGLSVALGATWYSVFTRDIGTASPAHAPHNIEAATTPGPDVMEPSSKTRNQELSPSSPPAGAASAPLDHPVPNEKPLSRLSHKRATALKQIPSQRITHSTGPSEPNRAKLKDPFEPRNAQASAPDSTSY